ncbi:NAD-dependent epimerase/dehydratase family protein [Marinoscillum furvescens]|uniref:UDP-glucose 4-epimerase n=1 Tax=Marinoscillum furvescens DSM 4134 TaxID=1122208 RepID=A0A3D9L1N8_MARFU|nr:NAD-dependent epimerase/dehydratase family protein [Marinoscillum furvescens]RED96143.1 UDP-glucose 4-epimerase [Marinoscillum furvescens DSM 4134]
MTILLTGASGFVGTRMLATAPDHVSYQTTSLQNKDVGAIDLSGISTVIHLAGIAHRMEPTPDALYHDVNHHLTLEFAEHAKTKGVKHFIFLSTIKVYGDETLQTNTITEATPCQPNDAYGASKLAAEHNLKELEDENFTVSIIRPPLIVGPGAKGNLLSLMKLAKKPIPLPFGDITNERAMVHVDNLIAFMLHLAENPKSGTYLINEEHPPSTTALISHIRTAMGYRRPMLVPIPSILRKLIANKKPELHQRLFGSIRIDASESREVTGFTPPHDLHKGIHEMVQSFLGTK